MRRPTALSTAYASLSYLRSFPFDKIKIDRNFVRDLDIGKRRDYEAIIQAVAELGRQMQISTVAEGVETLDQARAVTAAGCNELQGFYFSEPVPAGDASKVLAECEGKLNYTAAKTSDTKPATKLKAAQ